MTDIYSGDPLIIDQGDGGDLLISGGQPRMSSGIENALYLSWFVDANWFGNDVSSSEPGAVGSYRVMAVFRERDPLTPALLRKLKDACEADAAWMVTDGVAKSVTVDVTLPAVGMVGIVADVVEPDGTAQTVRWKLNWARMAQEVAS